MPLDSNTSVTFIQDRFEKTLGAQTTLSSTYSWDYTVVPIAQWRADELNLDAARDGTEAGTTPSLAFLATQTGKGRTSKAGALDRRLATIHTLSVQAVGVMHSRALADAALRPVVDELSARGGTNRIIEDEGGELLAAWKLEFAGDTFTPAPGNTYSGLRELFEGKVDAQGKVVTPSLRSLKSDYKDSIAADRSAQGRLNALLSRLEDQCVVWYAEASAVFAAGTVPGDMIRATVPTSDQYAPGTAPKKTPATTTPTPATVTPPKA